MHDVLTARQHVWAVWILGAMILPGSLWLLPSGWSWLRRLQTRELLQRRDDAPTRTLRLFPGMIGGVLCEHSAAFSLGSVAAVGLVEVSPDAGPLLSAAGAILAWIAVVARSVVRVGRHPIALAGWATAGFGSAALSDIHGRPGWPAVSVTAALALALTGVCVLARRRWHRGVAPAATHYGGGQGLLAVIALGVAILGLIGSGAAVLADAVLVQWEAVTLYWFVGLFSLVDPGDWRALITDHRRDVVAIVLVAVVAVASALPFFLER